MQSVKSNIIRIPLFLLLMSSLLNCKHDQGSTTKGDPLPAPTEPAPKTTTKPAPQTPVTANQGKASVTLNGEKLELVSSSVSILEDELSFPYRSKEDLLNGKNKPTKENAKKTGKRIVTLAFQHPNDKKESHLLTVLSYFEGKPGTYPMERPNVFCPFSWYDGDICNGTNINSTVRSVTNNCQFQKGEVTFTKVEISPGNKQYLLSGTFQCSFISDKNKYEFTNGAFENIAAVDMNEMGQFSLSADRQIMMGRRPK